MSGTIFQNSQLTNSDDKLTGTKFQKSWLNKLDDNGMEAGAYIQRIANNDFFSYCIICEKKFSTRAGFCRINEHAGRKIHHQNLFKLKKSQLKLQAIEKKTDSSVTQNSSKTLSSSKQLKESNLSGK